MSKAAKSNKITAAELPPLPPAVSGGGDKKQQQSSAAVLASKQRLLTSTTGPNAAAFDASSSTVSITINKNKNVAFLVSDSCWEKMGIFGEILIPDTTTLLGRRIQLTQIMLFALIALVGILVQVYTDSEASQLRTAKFSEISRPASLLSGTYLLLDALREEARIFFLNTADNYDNFLAKAQTAIRNTDTTLLWMEDWPRQSDFHGIDEAKIVNISTSTALSIALRNQRNLRKTDNATTEMDILNFYYTIIDTLTAVMYNIVLRTTRFKGWSELNANQRVFEMETNAQLLFFIACKFLTEERITDMGDPVFETMFDARVRYEELTAIASHDSSYTEQQINGNLTQQDSFRTFATLYSKIITMEYNDKEVLTMGAFVDAYTKTQSGFDWLQAVLQDRVNADVQRDTNAWGKDEIVSIISFADLFAHYKGIWRLQAHVIDTNNRAEMLDRAMMVLYDCIPRAMVGMVRAGEILYPRRATDICVVMFDINTASLMEDLEPAEFLDLLTQYFYSLEDTIFKFNCFKIDVVGDAFCIGSGAGEPHGIDHVTEMAFLALQLQDQVATIQVKEGSDDALRLRVGIHVGHGVSHVLHLQIPRMCVFGEAIEVASLIHATSLPLRIQASSAVYDRLTNCDDVDFARRGTLSVQGSKDIVVYWLTWAEEEPPEDDRMSRVSTPSNRHSHHESAITHDTSVMATHDVDSEGSDRDR